MRRSSSYPRPVSFGVAGPLEVLLVSPPLRAEQRYGRLAAAGMYMPPMGLTVLAASLRKAGHSVALLDCEALGLNHQEAKEQCRRSAPRILGLTAVTMSVQSAADLAALLKPLLPNTVFVLGGPHLSAAPEETLTRYPQFDVGVIGEGEETLLELVRRVLCEESITDLEGTIVWIGDTLRRNPNRALLEDIDTIPFPAWDLLPELQTHYRPSAFGFRKLPCMSVLTSRGCPGRCSFCSQGVWTDRYREHSAGYVLDMVRELYHHYGIRDLCIYDGTFGVKRSRLIELCELLIAERWDLVFSCNLRVGMADEKMLRLLKRAGCWGVAYGIESGSSKILEHLRKDITPAMIQRAITLTARAGLISKGYLMVGTPAETEETLAETLAFISTLDLDLLTVNSFTPFPGTLDWERADGFGTFDKDWSRLNQHSYAFVPHGLTRERLEYYVRLITRTFYVRPRVMINFARLMLNPYHLPLIYSGLTSFASFVGRSHRDL